jgi:BirA family biotin operon repressor/biotin-[acetyl-CoA-carboxylase] ligase
MNAVAEPGPAATFGEQSAYARPLDRDRIAGALQDSGIDVDAVLETGSTNSDLLANARARQPARPCLRAALIQTAGRGRLGRRWHSTPGASLLFSLALPLADSVLPAAATLACGIALAEVFESEAVPVRLKWPNDVLLDGRKLAGILCELAQDGDGARTLVIGVGVNLWADAGMRASAGQPLATLSERIGHARPATMREAMIARMANALLDRVGEYLRDGFVPLQPRYMRWFAHAEQAVEILEQDVRVAAGRALGVDGAGRLLVQTEAGLRAFISGEVSLRGAAGT